MSDIKAAITIDCCQGKELAWGHAINPQAPFLRPVANGNLVMLHGNHLEPEKEGCDFVLERNKTEDQSGNAVQGWPNMLEASNL